MGQQLHLGCGHDCAICLGYAKECQIARLRERIQSIMKRRPFLPRKSPLLRQKRIVLTGQTLGKILPVFGKIFCRFGQAEAISLSKFFASLGNSFGQIRAYPNRFGQLCNCPNLKGNSTYHHYSY